MYSNHATYSKTEKNLYLIGLAGQNILYGIITSALGYYLQFTIYIPAFWVGVILCIARVFDAVKDPFIGARLQSRNKSGGHLRGYLLRLPIPTALATVLCFVNGIYQTEQARSVKNICIIAVAFVTYIVWEILFTMGDIPMTGYPARMTLIASDKVKLLSLRPIGSIAASLCTLFVQPIAFALSSALGSTAQAEQKGFLITVIGLSIIGGILFQCTAIRSKERVPNGSAPRGGKNALAYFYTNPLLRNVLTAGILGSLKSMPSIVLSPIINYYFAGKNPLLSLLYMVLLGGGLFIGMLVSMGIVPKLTQKISNIRLFIYSNLLNILPNILIFLLYCLFPLSLTHPVNLCILFILMSISGICTSIVQTVQTLLIADAVDLEEHISCVRPDAVFFSCQTFLVKAGAGISSLAASLAYMLIHFSSAETLALNQLIADGGIPRENPDYAPLMTILFFLLTIPTAIGSLCSVLPFIGKRNR